MYSLTPRFGLGDPDWLDPAVAGGIFLASLVLAVVFHKLLFPLILRITQWTPTDFDTRIVRSTRRPLTLGIVVLGGYLAFTIPLDLSGRQQDAVDAISGLLGILLGVVALSSMISNAIDWYLENRASHERQAFDSRLLPLFRRVAELLVYGLGGLMMLAQLGISISPLIAGLGLGGLAVALALQPTLTNLFAGTYVMTEGVISPGDYVELENGVAGYVIGVSWRSTRIRTWGNNMVVIPNSKFAETIITNYQEPIPAVNVYLPCGVSYDSDLFLVERVCREVMGQVLETNPNAVKEYGSYFGFDSFGESNVDFWLFVQARDRVASFDVRTSLVQQLHQRFREEGIVINYPVRTLQFPKEWSPDASEELTTGRQMRIPKGQGGGVGDISNGDGDGPGPD